MRSAEYGELEAFLAVARERSFRRAADALSVSPSAISHTLRTLEDRLGARLFHRTTRSVALTDAGLALEQRLLPAFADIKGAVQAVRAGSDRPTGTLRLTVPRVAAQMVIAPVLGPFLSQYRDVRLEVTVDDALVDSVADGYDAGIRLDESVQRGMAAMPIGETLRPVLVGSPGYLTENGTPASPQELDAHHWLNTRFMASGRLRPWTFVRGGKEVALSSDGAFTTNDPDLLIAAALAGAGLAFIAEATIRDQLANGNLVRVLEEWTPPLAQWTLYYPSKRHIAPALRALIAFLAERPAT